MCMYWPYIFVVVYASKVYDNVVTIEIYLPP